MSPVEVISQVLKVHPTVGKFLIAGLAVLACAAVLISWGSNIADLKLGALYVLSFAFCATVLSFIVANSKMKAVLGWIIVSAFGAWTLGLVGTVFDTIFERSPRLLPSTACYLRLHLEPPEICEARLRQGDTGNDLKFGALRRSDLHLARAPGLLWPAQDVSTAPPQASQHSGLIFVQFTSALDRSAVIAFSEELVGLNWQVQEAKQGGELVKKGPDTNEVRYFKSDDRTSAIELAKTIFALHPEQPIYVRDFTRLGSYVKDGTLEIWLTQPLGEHA